MIDPEDGQPEADEGQPMLEAEEDGQPEITPEIVETEPTDPFAGLTKHTDSAEIRTAIARYRDEAPGERIDLRVNAIRVLKRLGIPSPGKLVDSVLTDAPVVKLHAKSGQAVLKGYWQSLANCCRVLENDTLRELVLGQGRLRWNLMTQEMEWCADGKRPQQLDKAFNAIFRLNCERRIFCDDPKTGEPKVVAFSEGTAEHALLAISKRDQYHPVCEWLNSLPEAMSGSIELAAKEALGISDELSMTLFCKFVVGAVARAFEPGCQLDTVLVFVAPQGGEKKSSAWRALVDGNSGSEWFLDTHLDMDGFKRQDAYMQLHAAWIYEVPELEKAGGQNAREKKKSFISSRVDGFRAPYDAVVRRHKRGTALGATTNNLDFLPTDDPAFCRRIWPIQIQGEIDCVMLANMRAEIWSEALALYRAGTPWHLTADEERLLAKLVERQEELSEHDAREPIVQRYLSDPQRATKALLLGDVMRVGLHLQPAQMADLRIQGGVRSIMISLGWESKYRRWHTNEEKSVRWMKGPIHGRGRIGALPAVPLPEWPETRDEP